MLLCSIVKGSGAVPVIVLVGVEGVLGIEIFLVWPLVLPRIDEDIGVGEDMTAGRALLLVGLVDVIAPVIEKFGVGRDMGIGGYVVVMGRPKFGKLFSNQGRKRSTNLLGSAHWCFSLFCFGDSGSRYGSWWCAGRTPTRSWSWLKGLRFDLWTEEAIVPARSFSPSVHSSFHTDTHHLAPPFKILSNPPVIQTPIRASHSRDILGLPLRRFGLGRGERIRIGIVVIVVVDAVGSE